ncbi:MAG TPA: hypothetical protein VFI31_20375 [Pirellulales bacterium]|nr:hypothetical protein [Pirellulales bacterium]
MVYAVLYVSLIVDADATTIAACAQPSVTLTADDQGRQVFELHGLDGQRLATVQDKPRDGFSVYAVFESNLAEPPPLAGTYENLPDGLRFTPRFPLEPGMQYRGVFRNAEEVVTKQFIMPKAVATPRGRVEAIFPSAGVLPQNQLKFYLHFTAPMSRGDAYRHLALLDADGNEVDLPFLELSEELWNPSGDRLTLLLDPARVKRELKPREEQGPVLEVGRHYTLIVRQTFCDAKGQLLANDFRKDFVVGEPDETCPAPRRWRLTVPQSHSEDPLVVEFGEPLDRALLERMLWVVDANGQRWPGDGAAGKNESSWAFRPDRPWQPGRYRLVADAWLEDLAGNSIARKFELRAAAEQFTEEETIAVEFDITPEKGQVGGRQ